MAKSIEQLVDELNLSNDVESKDINEITSQITVCLREESNRNNAYLRDHLDDILIKFNNLEEKENTNVVVNLLDLASSSSSSNPVDMINDQEKKVQEDEEDKIVQSEDNSIIHNDTTTTTTSSSSTEYITNFMKLFINFVAENEHNCHLLVKPDIKTNDNSLRVVGKFHHFLQQILISSNYTKLMKKLVVIFLRNVIISDSDDEVMDRIVMMGYPRCLLKYSVENDDLIDLDEFITVSDLLRDLVKIDHSHKNGHDQSHNHYDFPGFNGESRLDELTLDELNDYVMLVQRHITTTFEIVDFDINLWVKEKSDMEVDEEEEEDQGLVICTDLICQLSKHNDAFVYSTTTVKIQTSLTSLCELIFAKFSSIKTDVVDTETTTSLKSSWKKLSANLFDAMGLISADVKNSNKLELSFNISVVDGYGKDNEWKSPYSIVASLIVMGNSVNNKSDKLELLQLLQKKIDDDKKIDELLQKWFNIFNQVSETDVILLQGIHFFNLIWDSRFCNVLFALNNTKDDEFTQFILVFDRFFKPEVMTYYQPVSMLMCRFFNRFLTSIQGLVEQRDQQLGLQLGSSPITTNTEENDDAGHWNNHLLLPRLINGVVGYTLFEHVLKVLSLIKDDMNKVSIKYQLQTGVFKFISKLVFNKCDVPNDRFSDLVSLLLEVNELTPINSSTATHIPYEFICEKLKAIALILSSPLYYHYLLADDEEDELEEEKRNHSLTMLLQNMREIVVQSASSKSSSAASAAVPLNNLRFIGGKLKLLLVDDYDGHDEHFHDDVDSDYDEEDDDDDDVDEDDELGLIANQLMALI